MYNYVDDTKQKKDLSKTCQELILYVQKDIRQYFTFSFKLIGSGDTKLITRMGDNGPFDLDYDIVLQKDKKGLISDPKKIKELFINSFNHINPSYDFSFSQNSKSVITAKLKSNNTSFSFDVAILAKGDNGNYLKLIYDKVSDRYVWNEIKKSNNYQQKFNTLKSDGHWPDIQKLYLDKKNASDNTKASFSIFVETINELWNRFEQ